MAASYHTLAVKYVHCINKQHVLKLTFVFKRTDLSFTTKSQNNCSFIYQNTYYYTESEMDINTITVQIKSILVKQTNAVQSMHQHESDWKKKCVPCLGGSSTEIF